MGTALIALVRSFNRRWGRLGIGPASKVQNSRRDVATWPASKAPLCIGADRDLFQDTTPRSHRTASARLMSLGTAARAGEDPTAWCASRRPPTLRVVHVREAGSRSGRLVMSGRMSDVCAELDRLAEFERLAC